jgi:hypothetical protein
MCPPLQTGEQEAKHGVETPEVKTTTALQETGADVLLRYAGTYSGKVSGTW